MTSTTATLDWWEMDVTAPEPVQTLKVAQEPKPAPAIPCEKPVKIWIGTSIKGKGWEIYFDGSYDRTRVIFKRRPRAEVLEAVKAAGFFWSPAMKSWNKKLTCKAFKAAQELAYTLRGMCA